MPKNPSSRQQTASKENLRGHYGPKTEEGKKRSSMNGLRNKGIRTAKARARQVAGRWGPKSETFYSYANCLECKKMCLWPSFSIETPLNEMPLECLKEVLEEKPGRCFYYFEGFCCGSYVAEGGTPSGAASCILDDGFAEFTARRLGQPRENAERVELRERKRIWLLKKELAGYLAVLRRQGPQDAIWTPRMIHAVREIAKILKGCKLCRLEPWRSFADLEEIVEQLYHGDLPTGKVG